MKTATEILRGLDHFSGSETFTHHGMVKSVLMTEGVVWLAENAYCYWLVDIIASHQLAPKVKAEEFQLWTLKRNEQEGWWLITCDDGNGNIVATQRVGSSDFPLPEIKLYAEMGSVDGKTMNRILMLPGER